MANEYRRIVWKRGDQLPYDAQTTVNATGITISEDVEVFVRRSTTGYTVTREDMILALEAAKRQVMEMTLPTSGV
jgi:hypothetical protein